jgi:Whi5 like
LATQLKTRLTYAAIKVENGWEKHSFSQIKDILDEEGRGSSHPTHRRRSHTIQDSFSQTHRGGLAPSASFSESSKTYESFWANHSPLQRNAQSPSHPSHLRSSSSQPLFHGTFPRRKPERLSLQAIATNQNSLRPTVTTPTSHTARDQSAAEIMIALASPRTRSEFSSPERNMALETDEEMMSPSTPTRAKKRVELEPDTDALGIHA